MLEVPELARPGRKKQLAAGVLRSLDRLGVHVLPKHFYSSVPDRAWLRAHPDLWQRPAPLVGVGWDLDSQLAWLRDVCRPGWLGEVAGPSSVRAVAQAGIDFRYGAIEAQVLHCAVRRFAPARIIEVGSGASTVIMRRAAAHNDRDGRPTVRQSVIDPFASDGIKGLADVETIDALPQALQEGVFDSLEKGDLLFIDSSHAVKVGSELAEIYLAVIPALRPGVLVHVHDIYLPYLYSPWVLTDVWDWQETTLLLALLTGNDRLGVACCESALHHDRSVEMQKILPEYRPLRMRGGLAGSDRRGHYPSSTWLVTQ